jgi:hypothetical protein
MWNKKKRRITPAALKIISAFLSAFLAVCFFLPAYSYHMPNYDRTISFFRVVFPGTADSVFTGHSAFAFLLILPVAMIILPFFRNRGTDPFRVVLPLAVIYFFVLMAMISQFQEIRDLLQTSIVVLGSTEQSHAGPAFGCIASAAGSIAQIAVGITYLRINSTPD